MWVVQIVLLLLFVIVAIVFVSLNGGRSVEIISLGFQSFSNVPLNIIVVESAFFGALWALLVFFFIQLSSRIKIMRLKRLNNKLRDELDSLRILPLEDIPISEEEE
ncbi:LapA family protein [bacterium]|nr:LapA family protein [bacterium]